MCSLPGTARGAAAFCDTVRNKQVEAAKPVNLNRPGFGLGYINEAAGWGRGSRRREFMFR